MKITTRLWGMVNLFTVGMMLTTTACDNAQTTTTTSTQTAPAPGSVANTQDFTRGFVGKEANAFTLPDVNGKTVKLGGILGKRPIVLVFYRGVW